MLVSVYDCNRDPRVFSGDPNQFDITRPVEEATKHLSFGYGVHLCQGHAIGRLQLSLVFQTLLDLMPQLRLAKHVPVNKDNNFAYSTLHSLLVLPR